MNKGDDYEVQVLTIIRCSCVEFLRQKAVVSEALHSVSHRDHRHHEQPAPQHIQKATHPSAHTCWRSEDQLNAALMAQHAITTVL